MADTGTQKEIYFWQNSDPHFTSFNEVLMIQRINTEDYNLIKHRP